MILNKDTFVYLCNFLQAGGLKRLLPDSYVFLSKDQQNIVKRKYLLNDPLLPSEHVVKWRSLELLDIYLDAGLYTDLIIFKAIRDQWVEGLDLILQKGLVCVPKEWIFVNITTMETMNIVINKMVPDMNEDACLGIINSKPIWLIRLFVKWLQSYRGVRFISRVCKVFISDYENSLDFVPKVEYMFNRLTSACKVNLLVCFVESPVYEILLPYAVDLLVDCLGNKWPSESVADMFLKTNVINVDWLLEYACTHKYPEIVSYVAKHNNIYNNWRSIMKAIPNKKIVHRLLSYVDVTSIPKRGRVKIMKHVIVHNDLVSLSILVDFGMRIPKKTLKKNFNMNPVIKKYIKTRLHRK